MSTVDIDKLALILTAFANEAIRSDNPKLLHDEIVSALTQYRTHLKAELLAKIDGLEIDVEATTEDIEKAGGTPSDILNIKIEAEDRHETLNEFRKIVNEL